MSDCIFCKIVSNEEKSFGFWEDEDHLAFLSIFPNTAGTTVVIPKKHHDSYIANVDPVVREKLMTASVKVAKLLDSAFDDVGRTALVLEGFGINHLHVKLYPLHGTRQSEWKPIKSNVKAVFSEYQGFVSSHDGPLADFNELRVISEKIKKIL